MMGFALVALLFVIVALGCVLPSLVRSRASPAAADTDPDLEAASSNLTILRDEVAELERDLRNAAISREHFEQSRRELERRALEEARARRGAHPGSAPLTAGRGIRAALALILGLPIGALLLYLQLGTPAAISPPASGLATEATEASPQQAEATVRVLESRLHKSPDDAQAWAVLARTYFGIGRFNEAVAAYARATALRADDAELLADYANALVQSQGRLIDDRVLAIVERALKVDPSQWKALAIAGTGAFQRNDYARAIVHWTRLRQGAVPDSELGRMLDANIAEAQKLAGTPGSSTAQTAVAGVSGFGNAAQSQAQSLRPTSPGRSVSGVVTLSPALAAQASPTDTVFVFARAADGPRQPLAIVRHRVRDLPIEFNLDDAQAMAPQMKLSNFAEVIVAARVSKSAQATPQSGDLQGASRRIRIGAADVAVVIDTVVP